MCRCAKRVLSIMLLVCFAMSSFIITASAYTIQNNGVDGLYIDINSAPYTTLAQVPEWGQYAYGPYGCAWFASARAKELTGKNITTIYGGSNWYNNAYFYFGFSRSNVPQGKSLACWENHVAVIEWVYGDSVTISEGGYQYGNSNTGYCVIRSVKISEIEAGNNLTGSFLGYVYLGVDDGISSAPGKPDLWLETDYILAGTDFVIHHWAENAKSYSMLIYKDDELIVNSHHYTSTYNANFTATGQYRIVVSALNDIGEGVYSECIFTIYNIHNHIASSWEIYDEATVHSDGLRYKECTECGEVLETAVIPQLVPETPDLVSVANTTSGVNFTWSETEGADSYIVYRRAYNTKTKKWGGWTRIADDVTATSYVDKTAKSGVYYIYTVRAENEAGLSGYDSTGLKIKFLATPKLTSIANNTGKVTVKWNKVSGATGYIVYRKTYNASTKTWSGWSRLATTKSNSYNDTKAESGTYYRYTVRAYSGDYTSYFDTTGLKTKFLATPTLKSVSSAKSGVTVKWGKVAGAKGYDVYRKTYSGGKWTGWTKVATVSSGSTASVKDKTAKKGVTYRYTVRAKSDSYRSYFNTKGLQIKDKY